MELTVFSDKTHPPGEGSLRQVLGVMYDSFAQLLSVSTEYRRAWKYYGKKNGWLIKVEKNNKGLFWLTPLKDAYHIGFIFREHEVQQLKSLCSDAAVIHALKNPARYPEGYGISFLVNDTSLHLPVVHLVSELMVVRKSRKSL